MRHESLSLYYPGKQSSMSDTHIDQENLLKSLLANKAGIHRESLVYAAWAAAYTVKSPYVTELIEAAIGQPTQAQQRSIAFAVARMGVTNPYFLSRQFVNITAGGTLEALGFRPLSQLNVSNETAYHYACVAVSLINGGHVCLQSHVSILQSTGESDGDIDCVMRLAAVCHALAKAE